MLKLVWKNKHDFKELKVMCNLLLSDLRAAETEIDEFAYKRNGWVSSCWLP